jgi:hypothetical protein
MIKLRLFLTTLLLPAMLAGSSFLTAGCNGDGGDDAPAAEQKADPVAEDTADEESEEEDETKWVKGNVTGNWYYKNEIMKLKQSGASIQGTTEVIGFVNNPADPVEVPVPTVGSMASDGTVKVDELLIYTKNPAKNFKIKKVGGLKNANTLVLEVISGQKAHTQTWVKK